MITPSPSKDSGHPRRLLVTLVIATAAAAVTAGVALQKPQRTEAFVQRAGTSQALAGATAAPEDGATQSDPSLPSAAAALERAAGSSAEPASTF